jgi:hypothetical protein
LNALVAGIRKRMKFKDYFESGEADSDLEGLFNALAA